MNISDYIHVSTCVYYLCWTATRPDGIPSVARQPMPRPWYGDMGVSINGKTLPSGNLT